MQRFLMALCLLTVCASSFADSTVTVPWQEFKGLYAERIKNKLKKESEKDKEKPLYTVERALYQLTIAETGATGRILVTGRVLHGEPDPIPLFANDIAVNDVKDMVGGHLLTDARGYSLFADDGGEFRVSLGVSVPMRRDEMTRYVKFSVPRSVQNVLELSLPSSLRLSTDETVQQSDGRHYFAPTDTLTLRFEDLVQTSGSTALSIDTFTQIEFQGTRLVATHFFVPSQRVHTSVRLELDPSGGEIATSVPTEWVERMGNRGVVLSLPEGWEEPFIIQQETASGAAKSEIRLPRIERNAGREGGFQIEQAVDTRIDLMTKGVERGIPVQQLPQTLRAYADIAGTYSQLPAGAMDDGGIRLTVERLDTVRAPEIVLDAVYFYTSFAENGDTLTALHLTLPTEAGDKLVLKAIPDAEIWSVQVNGERGDLYTRHHGSWVIPLLGNTSSVVELAFLQRGEKLGLEGRLDLSLPATGLVARRINLAIGLSDRIDLIAMDSDLQPATPGDWPDVEGFIGLPHLFTRPFYRGEAVAASIYYKEPVNAAGGNRS